MTSAALRSPHPVFYRVSVNLSLSAVFLTMRPVLRVFRGADHQGNMSFFITSCQGLMSVDADLAHQFD